MPNVYLASPLGFAESTRDFMAIMESKIEACGYVVVNPWRLVKEEEYSTTRNIKDSAIRGQALHRLNTEVAANNEKAIRNCEILVAVLDGVDVDSGTASEIGFAYGLGKRIYGYRGDFRLAGDNEGSVVNLQVQYWIENSGGSILRSLEELQQCLQVGYHT